jgi:hypothetical protein
MFGGHLSPIFGGRRLPPKPVDNSLSNVIRRERSGRADGGSHADSRYTRRRLLLSAGARVSTADFQAHMVHRVRNDSCGDNTDRVSFATHRFLRTGRVISCLAVRARVDGPGPSVSLAVQARPSTGCRGDVVCGRQTRGIGRFRELRSEGALDGSVLRHRGSSPVPSTAGGFLAVVLAGALGWQSLVWSWRDSPSQTA